METVTETIEGSLRRVWKTLALRGLLGIAFGVVLLIEPELSVQALALTFGVFAAAHGITSIVAAARTRLPGRDRLWLVAQGAVSIAVGVVAFLWTDITERALVYCIAAWAVTFGVAGVIAAIRLPLRRSTSVLLGLDGALAVVFGAVLFARPAAGAIALVLLLAAVEISMGITSLLLAREVRGVEYTARHSLRAPVAQS